MHEDNGLKTNQDCMPEGQSSGQDASVSVLKLSLGLVVMAVLIGGYWALLDTGLVAALTDEERLQSEAARLGIWGGIVFVALMAVAIVMSPIPSGPIAIAAGAVYGPVLGAVYVIVGAELGALIAFGLARWLGYSFVCRWLGGRLRYLTAKRSQRRLMAIVFVSRLIPFISFDAVSYAAGLTPLSFWRFAVATLIGIIPISILLTYSGGWLISTHSNWATLTVIVIGGVTVIPVILKLVFVRYRRLKNAK